MLERSAARFIDHGTHLVVRTPTTPTFWSGDFLLLAGPPSDEEGAAGVALGVRTGFPEARHRTFGIDGTTGAPSPTSHPFTGLGLETEASAA